MLSRRDRCKTHMALMCPNSHLKKKDGTSLVSQWLRLHLPMQGDVGSIPSQEAKIPQALGLKKTKQNVKREYCNKFSKDFKNGPHQKKILKKNKGTRKQVKLTPVIYLFQPVINIY